jgi:hypothetical protein
MDGGNEYGNEEEDYNDNEGGDPNKDENGNQGGNEGDVDQYFDDAGDIGYLPADHVTPSICC